MEDREVKSARIYTDYTRIGKLINKFVPGLVKKHTFLEDSDGNISHIALFIPSSEGVRFFGSEIPLQRQQSQPIEQNPNLGETVISTETE